MKMSMGNLTPDGQHPVRHGFAFLISGGVAFGVDALVLMLLTHAFGLHPIIARLFAISLAMVTAWLMHRTFTFAVKEAPSLAEFLRYAGVAWTAAGLNYLAFAVLLLIWPGMYPLAALVVSSVLAMMFSYLGMRLAIFRPRDGAPPA